MTDNRKIETEPAPACSYCGASMEILVAPPPPRIPAIWKSEDFAQAMADLRNVGAPEILIEQFKLFDEKQLEALFTFLICFADKAVQHRGVTPELFDTLVSALDDKSSQAG